MSDLIERAFAAVPRAEWSDGVPLLAEALACGVAAFRTSAQPRAIPAAHAPAASIEQRRAEADERAAAMHEARGRRESWEEIATRYGYSSAKAAQNAYYAWRDRRFK